MPVLSDAAIRWSEALVEALRSDYLFMHCAVFLAAPDDGSLVLAAQRWGAGEDVGEVIPTAWTVPLEGSVVGRVYRTGAPSLVADVRMDPDYRGFPGAYSRSELAVPIAAAGLTVGVLNLESPRIAAYGMSDLDRVQAGLAAAAATYPGAG